MAQVGCPDRRSTGSALRAVRPPNLQDPAPLQLTANDHLVANINAMHLKGRLSDVETDCSNCSHLAPPIRGSSSNSYLRSTRVPVEEPSTASIADQRADILDRQLRARSRHRLEQVSCYRSSFAVSEGTCPVALDAELQFGPVQHLLAVQEFHHSLCDGRR